MRGVAVSALALCGCLSHHDAPPAAAADHAALQLSSGQIRVVDQGSGDPIVLLHGFGAAIESWGTTLEVLSQNHRVLALDARGFGLSSRGDGDYSLAALADDVDQAMALAGIERATIAAHSWGSAIALVFALRHPDRVERLVLVDSLAYERQIPWAMKAARTPGIGEFIVGTFYTSRLDANLEEAFFDPSILTYADVAAIRYVTEAPGSRASALAISRGVRLSEWQDRYAEIDVPTLIVWGKQDRILGRWWADRLAGDLGQAEVATIDRCGHFPMLESPERFTALVEDFVR